MLYLWMWFLSLWERIVPPFPFISMLPGKDERFEIKFKIVEDGELDYMEQPFQELETSSCVLWVLWWFWQRFRYVVSVFLEELIPKSTEEVLTFRVPRSHCVVIPEGSCQKHVNELCEGVLKDAFWSAGLLHYYSGYGEILIWKTNGCVVKVPNAPCMTPSIINMYACKPKADEELLRCLEVVAGGHHDELEAVD